MSVDPELLDRALTHRSYAYEQGGLPTNERLEFLGDSVLGLVVTEHLFVSYPELSEGQLAKLRAAVVNSRALADVARDLDLGAVVHLGRGEESTGGRDKSSILADTMEAMIGAVFLQHGIDAARDFVHHLFDGLMADVATRGAGLDWKTSLQESASIAGFGVPFYEVVESGPDHAKTFQAMVHIDDQRYGPGAGRNKKEAEQNAACPGLCSPEGRARPRFAACLSFPKSKSSGAVSPRASPAAGSPPPRCCIPGPVRRHLLGAADFEAQLIGRTFAEPRRRGKYLWLPFADGDAILAHLGMSGQFRLDPAAAPLAANTRVLISFTDGEPGLRFVDQRMFGGLSLSTGGAELPAEVAHIGRDPFDPEFDLAAAVARLRAKRTGIKRALLDQQLVSGIGNIYADEALWAARMHYAQPTQTLTRARATEVVTAAATVMHGALGQGGTSFDALYVNVNGSSGYFDRSLAAYGREGEPCPRCGTPSGGSRS
jgi:ribonuclease III/DNA-formamidopyrimidine glycosylase